MATLLMHNIMRRFSAKLDAGIDASQTSVVISSITALDTPTAPFYIRCGDEWMECTAYADATPSAGKGTMTVTRGVQGTTAAEHLINTDIAQVVAGFETNEATARLFATEKAFVTAIDGDGVIREATASTALKVVAQVVPTNTVSVSPGAGIVSGQPVQILAATTSGTFTAPVGNFRIDIVQIDQTGLITIKQGSLGGAAPTVDAGKMKLAEVYMRAGKSTIKNTDDSVECYITDKRDFA